jgi:hypothetical protein
MNPETYIHVHSSTHMHTPHSPIILTDAHPWGPHTFLSCMQRYPNLVILVAGSEI